MMPGPTARSPGIARRDQTKLLCCIPLLCLGALGVLAIQSATTFAREPALPSGLGEPPADEPSLPTGLGDAPQPSTLKAEPAAKASPFRWRGFYEARIGARTQTDDHASDLSIAEGRLQLGTDLHFDALGRFTVTADFVYDPLLDRHEPQLETGRGAVDLRELWYSASPLDFMDVKLGRQILTWGTGDLLFLNDLFPKDWNAFLIGRDVEYLKAPSDAVKVSLFSDLANVDLVYTPAFDADRFIDGRQVSYYNPMLGRVAGDDAVNEPDRPDHWFSDDEWAWRLYRNFRGYEVAVYGYVGYWKSPGGFDAAAGVATFPPLAVHGASVRGPLLDGIANVEFAYYDSLDDRGGDEPFTPNRQTRWLVGYEREIATDLTLGLQYYLEWTLDHDAYERTALPGAACRDELRHVVTTRLTWLTRSQNLEWSLFVFFSPSDRDAYLRPRVSYDLDDHWKVEVGGNVFVGANDTTFFGQFEDNTNVYAAVRYSF